MTRLRSLITALLVELDAELVMLASCLEALERDRPRRRRRGSPRHFWTDTEREELRRLYPDTRSADVAARLQRPLRGVYQMARKLGVEKSEAYLRSPDHIAFIRPGSGGERYRYPKGHVPANKGIRRPGWHRGRMKETWFKKGELAGAAQAKWVPVGTEVLDDDGYLKRKISDDRTIPSRFNWRYVHALIWEAKHGPVPRGFAVAFKNGDKTDIREENLELVSRRELMRRNSVHNLPPALAQVVQLRGALVRQIRKRERASA